MILGCLKGDHQFRFWFIRLFCRVFFLHNNQVEYWNYLCLHNFKAVRQSTALSIGKSIEKFDSWRNQHCNNADWSWTWWHLLMEEQDMKVHDKPLFWIYLPHILVLYHEYHLGYSNNIKKYENSFPKFLDSFLAINRTSF
jgi:hypothetical protein